MTTFDDDTNYISPIFSDLMAIANKGELGEAIYALVSKFSHIDLHILGSALQYEISVLPMPYREHVEPYLTEELLGRYYRILSMHSDGSFEKMGQGIRDRKLFEAFCQMAISFGTEAHGSDEGSLQYAQLGGLSYFLLHCFVLFVLEEPCHPVGMPFSDGFTVKRMGNEFYCPVRDREKDTELALCNFCPAKHAELSGHTSPAHDYTN